MCWLWQIVSCAHGNGLWKQKLKEARVVKESGSATRRRAALRFGICCCGRGGSWGLLGEAVRLDRRFGRTWVRWSVLCTDSLFVA